MSDSQDQVTSQHTPVKDNVNDLPVSNGLIEEAGYITRPDKPSRDGTTDTDHVDLDHDLVESKESPESVNGPAKNDPVNKAPGFPDGTSKSSTPDTRTDPSHRDIPTSDHPFHVRDEINLEPVFASLGKKPVNRVHLPPGSSKTITKRIQLNKVRSFTDLSRADEGHSYGLPENDSRQPEVIIQGSNEEPTLDVNDKKDHSTTKAKEGDPEGIDISSLSLGINPEEVTVLKEIFQGKRE